MRRSLRIPTVRSVVLGLLLAITGGSLCTSSARASEASLRKRVEVARRDLHERLRVRLGAKGWARADGHVYTIDVAQLLTYAAMRDERELYGSLRQQAQAALVGESVTGGEHTFVAWRFSPEKPERRREASGTTEALELARGLWQGAAAFEAHRDDRDLALAILDGYLAHQRVSFDVWLIRNYFNFETHAFADDSYLVDYAPDFVSLVADSTGRSDLCELASRSAQLLRAARTPAGLYHAMVSPGLKTLMPFAIHSPNGVEALSNVVAVATRSVATNRNQAREVLHFARERLADLRLYYDARTGEPRRDAHAGVATLASLVCLSVLLDDAGARDALLPRLLEKLREVGEDRRAELYLLGQALWALELSWRHMRGDPVPVAFRADASACAD